jgi:heme/copper-type cytochrome/quinol oxidase subunit 2
VYVIDADEADIMVILATTLAMMVFFLVIAVGVICCCRRYRRKPETDWKDTSTTSSNKNILPDYPTNYYPAYPINNPKF